MDAPELLPCPFCGATNIEPDYMNTPFGLECKSCGASGPPDSYQDPDEAAAAWNTRADLVDQMIAEAVAKERERCARVADSKRNQFFGNGADDWEAGFVAAIDSTAAAIREGVAD